MANVKGSDNPFPSVLFAEHVDPANPSAGTQRLFVDTDHLLKLRDSSGTVVTYPTSAGTGLSDPMTTRGDIIIRNASNVTARLGRGSASQVLTSDGTDIAWATPTSGGVTRSTLGTTSAGASFGTTRGTYLKKITLASAGLLASVHVFGKGDGSSLTNVAGMLYSDSSGTPLNILSASHAVATTGGATADEWILNTTVRDLSFAMGRWLTAGDYWIGINDMNSTATFSMAFNSGTGGDYQVSAANPPKDNSVAAFSSTSNDWCIYADIIR